jgi:hypothetical protein
MDGMRATIGGRNLIFGLDGKVSEAAAGGETVVGAWRSESTQKDNKIRYTLNGAEQTAVQAFYSFNVDNQLTASLDSASNPAFTFPGGIEVDDQHDIVYNVIDPATGASRVAMAVYGPLSFTATSTNLQIALAGGGTAEIKGDLGAQSLESAQNNAATAGFKADDLLRFKARTRNKLATGADATKIAKLKFIGNWDVEDGKIVFVSKIAGSPTKPGISLGFGGQFKAVAAGFVYFSDGNRTTIALNIRGSHQRVSGKGTTNIKWETSLGFTEKKFEAAVNVKASHNFASGQALTIEGDLKLKKGPKEFTFDLSLDAVYEFKGGVLVFSADIKNGVRPSYDLGIEGDFVYRNLKITFKAHFSSVGGSKEVAVSVGVEGDENSIVKHLSIMLNISQSEARAKVSANLEISASLRFVNGKRVIKAA